MTPTPNLTPHPNQVPPALRLACLPTRHQFVMLSAPPERQATFDALKATHGSAFAWHGSSPENWHAQPEPEP